MKSKKIIFNTKNNKILRGINKLANSVKSTLGPKGNNVIIERKFEKPLIIKDGVTVAKEIYFKNSLENIGAQIIKEVAQKTNEYVGDGTTTATLLTQYIINEGRKFINIGINFINIKKGINKILKNILIELDKISKKITKNKEIKQIATISANNDSKIGNLIAKAIKKVGKDGIISIEKNKSFIDELEIVRGIQFDEGYQSSYFINNEKQSVEFVNPYVLIYNGKINNFKIILPILEKINKNGKSLVILLKSIDKNILNTLILNNLRGIIKIVVIKTPGFESERNSFLEDISYLTGGKIFKKTDKIKKKLLGKLKKIEVKKKSTIFFSKIKNTYKIKKRILFLKKILLNIDSDYEKEKIKERIAKLSGGIALIKIGSSNEIELKEKISRTEDALNAAKAALEEGIVPGGGIAFIRIKNIIKKKINFYNKEKKIGGNIILNSLEQPFIQIIKNGSYKPEIILSNIKNMKFNFGYNLYNNKYCDMYLSGVIDPVKVLKIALQNSVSVSLLFLSSNCTICYK
ncbi:chaperonin GroEL [Candidatus Vidania fulgoroideorum]